MPHFVSYKKAFGLVFYDWLLPLRMWNVRGRFFFFSRACPVKFISINKQWLQPWLSYRERKGLIFCNVKHCFYHTKSIFCWKNLGPAIRPLTLCNGDSNSRRFTFSLTLTWPNVSQSSEALEPQYMWPPFFSLSFETSVTELLPLCSNCTNCVTSWH